MKVIKNILIIKSRLGSPLILLACFTYIFEKVRKLFKFNMMEKSFHFLKGNLIIFLRGWILFFFLKKKRTWLYRDQNNLPLRKQWMRTPSEITPNRIILLVLQVYTWFYTHNIYQVSIIFLVVSNPVCASSGSHDFVLSCIPSSFGNIVNWSWGDHWGNHW